MYFDDHGVAHFHVIDADDRRASISIRDLKVLAGAIDARALREAQEWARAHQALLLAKWKTFNE